MCPGEPGGAAAAAAAAELPVCCAGQDDLWERQSGGSRRGRG